MGEDKCFNPKRRNRWNFREHPKVRVAVILILSFTLFGLSLVLGNVGPVSSVEGAVTILCLICIFPILMAWKIGMHSDTDDYVAADHKQKRFLVGLQVMLLIGI